MASIRTAAVSSPPQAYHSSSQRGPSRKSSFLSLKRDKPTPDTLASPAEDSFEPTYPVGSSPPSVFGFESNGASHHSSPQGHSPKSRRSKSSSKSVSSVKEGNAHRRAKGSRGQLRSPGADQQFFDFPVRAEEHFPWPGDGEDSNFRARATSGPSNRDWETRLYSNRPPKYPFRDSGSSSMSHFETPPQTPLDDYSFRERPFHVPVVVAAPVPGVETMDALVDGMNGFTEDEQFIHLTGLSSRSQYKKTGYHPLYHPPLPTPPPGVKLGKQSDSDSDHESRRTTSPKRSQHTHHEKHAPPPSRKASRSTLNRHLADPPVSIIASTSQRSISCGVGDGSRGSIEDKGSRNSTLTSRSREPVPSINDIIKAYAPAAQQTRTRPSSSRRTSYATSHECSTQPVLTEAPEPAAIDEESDLISRSSVDTIAEEIQRTIRNQTMSPVTTGGPPQSVPFPSTSRPQSVVTNITRSPMSDGRRNSSLYDYSVISDRPPLPPMDLSSLTKAPINSPSQTIAQYLRSSRLTTIMKLTRAPHASRDNPLTVSFSDLGNPTGFPLVVFLGLGCVRHIMGLYDEMAECLGIRLITIDRVMAHSAGAPYALAFANRFPERVRGDVCLLAPWVGGGEGAGYKWLKYVPNGILKTAQAAEWKVQAWMLGKPPTIAYEGIGFDVEASMSPSANRSAQWALSPTSTFTDTSIHATQEIEARPSVDSTFSEYDDLRDFEGKFDSGSSLGRRSTGERRARTTSESKHSLKPRKSSRGFLGRLRGTSHTSSEEHTSNGAGKKLKALRSMGSLKGRSASTPLQTSSKTAPPTLPPDPDVGLGLDGLDWDATIRVKPSGTKSVMSHSSPSQDHDTRSSRASGRRSVSFGASTAASTVRARPPPVPPVPPLSPTAGTQSSVSYQAALGNALIAASHAESSKGTHCDLLQILNHDRLPWGFSYGAYPHHVRIWYGDRDEKIAENAVRWMETSMGPDKCQVKVVKGADHALMFKSSIVVDVLEYFADCWRSGRQ
ncbi:hypothetical protein EIP86_000845 [Pleurotus ostreatoroseus]|nr:hypothetical protein EIP86_000845 [Pleurotus ostreatoroseus]